MCGGKSRGEEIVATYYIWEKADGLVEHWGEHRWERRETAGDYKRLVVGESRGEGADMERRRSREERR